MYPKQLLPLVGEKTMLQETALRLSGKDNLADDTIVVCNEAHRFLVAQQLSEIDQGAKIILEPEGRNTAPAVARGTGSVTGFARRCGCAAAAGNARRSRDQ